MVDTNEQAADEQRNDPAPVAQGDGDSGSQAEDKAEESKAGEDGE